MWKIVVFIVVVFVVEIVVFLVLVLIGVFSGDMVGGLECVGILGLFEFWKGSLLYVVSVIVIDSMVKVEWNFICFVFGYLGFFYVILVIGIFLLG